MMDGCIRAHFKSGCALIMVASALGLAPIGATSEAQEHHDHGDHAHDDHHEHDHDGHDHDGHDQAAPGADMLGAAAAHVHGTAELLVALDGRALTAEFRSPLWNLVGFEHKPRTPEQMATLAGAVTTLTTHANLLTPPMAARCTPGMVDIDQPFDLSTSAQADHGDHHGHDHEGHDHDDHEGHDHDDHEGHDHGDHEGHDHGDHEGHDHGDHDDSAHSELTARYVWTCARPGALTTVEVTAFAAFAGLETIEAALLTDTGEASGDLTRTQRRLTVR